MEDFKPSHGIFLYIRKNKKSQTTFLYNTAEQNLSIIYSYLLIQSMIIDIHMDEKNLSSFYLLQIYSSVEW